MIGVFLCVYDMLVNIFVLDMKVHRLHKEPSIDHS